MKKKTRWWWTMLHWALLFPYNLHGALRASHNQVNFCNDHINYLLSLRSVPRKATKTKLLGWDSCLRLMWETNMWKPGKHFSPWERIDLLTRGNQERIHFYTKLEILLKLLKQTERYFSYHEVLLTANIWCAIGGLRSMCRAGCTLC